MNDKDTMVTVELLELDRPTKVTGRTYLSEGVEEAIAKFNAREPVRGEFGMRMIQFDGQYAVTPYPISKIKEDRISHAIFNLRIVSGEDGDSIVGDVLPTGPFGEALKEILATDPGKATFGVRVICLQNNPKELKVMEIITFDLINLGDGPIAPPISEETQQ